MWKTVLEEADIRAFIEKKEYLAQCDAWQEHRCHLFWQMCI